MTVNYVKSQLAHIYNYYFYFLSSLSLHPLLFSRCSRGVRIYYIVAVVKGDYFYFPFPHSISK